MPRRFCKRARPRATPPLPPVRAPSGRAAALPSPHPVRAPQHARSHLPSACRSTPALTFRSRAAPAGARGPAGLASASYTCRRGHSSMSRIRLPPRDGAGWHGSAPAVHPRPPAWPFPPFCFCALSNYHSAVLTNARPPCYAEASAGRGRSAPPRRPAAGNEPGRTLRTPRRPAAGNEPGRDVPANPAPAAPCSPRGAPEGNGSPPKTNGLRARHRAAGGKEAACSASSCPRCARWRR